MRELFWRLSDGCFAAGGILLCIGILWWTANAGGFDLFTYAAARMRGDRRCYAEHRRKRCRRGGWGRMMLAGGGLLFASALFLLLIK